MVEDEQLLRQSSFDIVAVFGDNVAGFGDIVAAFGDNVVVYGPATLSLVWTGLKASKSRSLAVEFNSWTALRVLVSCLHHCAPVAKRCESRKGSGCS